MNYLFAAVAGTTWFLQFFFYGMGESKLGNGASSWILHMATIIITSNFWGLYFKEWKGSEEQVDDICVISLFLFGKNLLKPKVFTVPIELYPALSTTLYELLLAFSIQAK